LEPRYIAHTRNQQGKYHDLIEHLRSVAALAAEYAEALGPGASDLARYVGLWHDIGKFNPQFQEYLLRSEADPSLRGTGPDHKAAGAEIALRHLQAMALLVQGHHGGLHSPAEMDQWLKDKKRDMHSAIQGAIEAAHRALPEMEPDSRLLFPNHVAGDRNGTVAELFLRLLFSALVDADCLDTEAHFHPEKAQLRGSDIGMEELWRRFEQSQAQVAGQGSAVVAQARDEIYRACCQAAKEPPGLFRLTVPTGGGKTRSGMAFALRHAMRYGHQRIIVAVPFISITEQTAQTYRQIFEPGSIDAGDSRPVVLEHHSGGLTGDKEDDFLPSRLWQRLASENWDAPIIVTTTVQLFESLFASGTSRCRKLHRLARSVIILDEAQALPVHLLKPILDGLTQLCRYYGTTVVLSTATQPAFDTFPGFKELNAREIVPDPARYFEILKRVEYEWRSDSEVSWQEVAQEMSHESQALCVTNTKKDAIALLDALWELDGANTLHLSTLLSGVHRRAVINETKARLARGEPVRLASTQVIEAGVDLDFPVVWRTFGPLDSIIQAAGRCNREGKLQKGRVVIFRPVGGGMPLGAYRTGAGIARALLGRGQPRPDDPRWLYSYFRDLYATVDTDRDRIQDLRARFNYSKTAELFRMIDDDTVSVVVRFSSKEREHERKEEIYEIDKLLNSLRSDRENTRLIMRRLQPYIVSLRRRQARQVRDLIEPVVPGSSTDDPDGLPALGLWLGGYDKVRGLELEGKLDPDRLVV
jgi:CRISPR-associated endonuclease/helicase Cas3